jgi:transcriptional regulator
MLYNPPAFRVEDADLLHAHIDQSGLAMLVTNGEEGPLVSHVPLLLDRAKGPRGTLLGHLAKPNLQWQISDVVVDALAVFPGPDAYIRPSWYATKREHGRVVPTWNYTVVHARGRLEFFEDAGRLREAVERLTNQREGNRDAPWAVSDAPERYVQAQLKAIVGFELEIKSLEGKHKLSQNRPAADKELVVEGLGEAGETVMKGLVQAAIDKG